jgi:hypothetical protein
MSNNIKPIQYRRVYNEKGDFEQLELSQDGNVIQISLAHPTPHYSGYRWDEVKDIIDKHQKAVTSETSKNIEESYK